MDHELNLVLDLDDTLIKCDLDGTYSMYDFLVEFEGNPIYYRPDLFKYLTKWNKSFNLHIYTNGSKEYCTEVLSSIKLKVPEIKINKIQTRIQPTANTYLFKSLSIIDLDPNNTIIIDDIKEVWTADLEPNIIKIRPFNEIGLDHELVIIDHFLTEILDKYKYKYKSKHKNENIVNLISDCNTRYSIGSLTASISSASSISSNDSDSNSSNSFGEEQIALVGELDKPIFQFDPFKKEIEEFILMGESEDDVSYNPFWDSFCEHQAKIPVKTQPDRSNVQILKL